MDSPIWKARGKPPGYPLLGVYSKEPNVSNSTSFGTVRVLGSSSPKSMGLSPFLKIPFGLVLLWGKYMTVTVAERLLLLPWPGTSNGSFVIITIGFDVIMAIIIAIIRQLRAM